MKRLFSILFAVFCTLQVMGQFGSYRPYLPNRNPQVTNPFGGFNFGNRNNSRSSDSRDNSVRLPMSCSLGILGVTTLQDCYDNLCKVYDSQKIMHGSSGPIGQIMLSNDVEFLGIPFKSCMLNFFKNTLWSVSFRDCKANANEVGVFLEKYYQTISVPDEEYTYDDGKTTLRFEGYSLSLINNSLARSYAKSILNGEIKE